MKGVLVDAHAVTRSPIAPRWLVRLRWAAITAQLVSLAGTHYLLRAPFPLWPLLGVVAVLVASNVALSVRLRREEPLSDALVAANLLVDNLGLTVLLTWTGGAMNPFTTLYLLQVALAAILVPRRWSLLVTVAAVAMFGGLLLARPEAIHVWHSASMFMLHVRGMWLAFAVTAGFLWIFVDRVSTSLRAREAELAAARLEGERAVRWSALGTLTAGTAHELNTPLGTVAILAAELADTLPQGEAQAQAEQIRVEVRRCKEILQRMRAHVPTADEPTEMDVDDWVTAVVEAWRLTRPDCEVTVTMAPSARGVRAPLRAEGMRQALFNLLENARHALGDRSVHTPVEVSLARDGASLVLSVSDRGAGVPAAILPRLGEPFFTTREPGQGMGLGLFLVQGTAARHGGSFAITSAGGVTRATMTLPCASTEAATSR